MIQEVPYKDVLVIRQEVMYPGKDLDFVTLDEDDLGLHIGFYEDDLAVSIVSLFLHGRELQFRKFATLVNLQGKGYGSKLMKWVLDYAKDMKFERVWCNARVDKLGFYEKFGFTETAEKFSKNGHDYVIIEKMIVE